MTLKDMADEYRRNADALTGKAGELRRRAKTEKMSRMEAGRLIERAARYESVAGENLRTAMYLEEYYSS